MPEKIRKPQHDRSGAPAPGSVEEFNANHLSASAGHPIHMPDGLRARLEARTGVDLGNIQMRESGQPESIGARAFTRGNVIDFAPGEFRPGTEEGEALIRHEVSHVLQQASGQVHADTGASPVNADPALEHAADMGVHGGMESVPSMSYAASPVQGLFGLNHFRQWRQRRAAKKASAKADEPVASVNHSLDPMNFRTTDASPLSPAGAGNADPAALASVFENADEEVDLNTPLTPPSFAAPKAPVEEAQIAPAPSGEIDLNTPLTPPSMPAPKSPDDYSFGYMPMKPPSFAAPKSPDELKVMQEIGPMKPEDRGYRYDKLYALLGRASAMTSGKAAILSYEMQILRNDIMNELILRDPVTRALNKGVTRETPPIPQDVLDFLAQFEEES